MDIKVTAYRPTEEPAKLRAFPDLQRLTHFKARQMGPERYYKVELEFQWEGGHLYGADVPCTEDPYDIEFLTFRKGTGEGGFGYDEWLACPSDQPLYPGSAFILDDLAPYIRQFVNVTFLQTMKAT